MAIAITENISVDQSIEIRNLISKQLQEFDLNKFKESFKNELDALKRARVNFQTHLNLIQGYDVKSLQEICLNKKSFLGLYQSSFFENLNYSFKFQLFFDNGKLFASNMEFVDGNVPRFLSEVNILIYLKNKSVYSGITYKVLQYFCDLINYDEVVSSIHKSLLTTTKNVLKKSLLKVPSISDIMNNNKVIEIYSDDFIIKSILMDLDYVCSNLRFDKKGELLPNESILINNFARILIDQKVEPFSYRRSYLLRTVFNHTTYLSNVNYELLVESGHLLDFLIEYEIDDLEYDKEIISKQALKRLLEFDTISLTAKIFYHNKKQGYIEHNINIYKINSLYDLLIDDDKNYIKFPHHYFSDSTMNYLGEEKNVNFLAPEKLFLNTAKFINTIKDMHYTTVNVGRGEPSDRFEQVLAWTRLLYKNKFNLEKLNMIIALQVQPTYSDDDIDNLKKMIEVNALTEIKTIKELIIKHWDGMLASTTFKEYLELDMEKLDHILNNIAFEVHVDRSVNSTEFTFIKPFITVNQ